MARADFAPNAATRAEATTLSARLPGLVIAARHVAMSVRHGVHGRRRAGPGETFWQFRPFLSGEPAHRIDWRRSARESRAYVREREWEAAQTLWLWFERSPSMDFRSELATTRKIDRGAVLTLALADLAVRGGERAGLLGLTRPIAARDVIDRFAEALVAAERRGAKHEALPPAQPIASRAKVALIGDFLSSPDEIAGALSALAAEGASGEVLMVADPIEETFPYLGHTEFLMPGRNERFRAPRAEDLRLGYLARLAEHREQVKSLANSVGWGFALHRTDHSPAAALLALHARLSAGVFIASRGAA